MRANFVGGCRIVFQKMSDFGRQVPLPAAPEDQKRNLCVKNKGPSARRRPAEAPTPGCELGQRFSYDIATFVRTPGKFIWAHLPRLTPAPPKNSPPITKPIA